MNDYLNRVKELLDNIVITDIIGKTYKFEIGMSEISSLLRACKKNQNTMYLCGNGGSAGIAQHMSADFLKNGGIRTYNLFGQSTITCISNDLNYEYVFCKQLELLAKNDDILVAISSSGESENIVKSVQMIKKKGGAVITFTGFKPQNRVRELGDWNVYIPAEHYGMVESIHNIILQQLVDGIVETDGIALQLET